MDENNNTKIMVSICCITYNHEKYISESIESFLMQKTNFKYEILINDDSSTDSTQQIIKRYEKKYPNIIKVTYQVENQHSKGKKSAPFLFEKAKGKYIALCEGDDYWLSKSKLQKQVDFMEANPDYSLCFHSTQILRNKSKKSYFRPYNGNKTFDFYDLMHYHGTMLHTSSMLFTAKFLSTLPKYYYSAPVGDSPLKIYLALNGKLYYIDEVLSVYRSGLNSSWSSRNMKNKAKKNQHCDKMCDMLDKINHYYKFKYDDIFKYRKLHYEFAKQINDGNYKGITSKKLHNYYRDISLIKRAKLCLKIKLKESIRR